MKSELVKKLAFILLLLTGLIRADENSSRLVVQVLDYIANDYPGAVERGKVTNQFEYDEQKSLIQSAIESFQSNPELKDNRSIFEKLQKIKVGIDKKISSGEISQLSKITSEEVMSLSHLEVHPKFKPDIHRGKFLYEKNCITCHGANGQGDGPLGKNLNPPPTNFTEPDRMKNYTPFQAFNTIRLGVAGTGMMPFKFSDEDTWNLAYYVNSFFHKSENVQISLTKSKLQTSLELYKNGKVKEAKQEAVLAYLDGVEPIEPNLRTKNVELVNQLENIMTIYRKNYDAGVSYEVQLELLKKVFLVLEEANKELSSKSSSFGSVYFTATGIIVREALEAVLILILLFSLARNLQIQVAIPYIHAGWIAAIGIGIVGWFFSGWVLKISGLSRELLEGVVSLLAVLVLLYIGFWLHRKSKIQQWIIFIKQKANSAARGKSFIVLSVVAFFAVFREVFETILFLRAIVLEAGPQTEWIVGVAFLSVFFSMLVLSYWMVKLSLKLPIQKMFAVSNALMGFLALILIGKAVHSFQEIAYINQTLLPIDFRFESLGIFPTYETFAAQLVVLILVLLISIFDSKNETS